VPSNAILEAFDLEPVDGEELLDQLDELLQAYVVMSAAQSAACALWVMHTHALDSAAYSPYLAVVSAEMRSGKTTLMKLLELLAARPWRVITPSEAVAFRKIDRDHPTLLLDEFDTIWKDREQEPLRALLNAGNEPGTKVPRCAGANRDELREFNVYCPKALAGIGKLPQTIADRSIEIRLKRKAPGDQVARFRRREVVQETEPLRAQLAAWACDLADTLAEARPQLPDELDDRAQDGWEPLLAIADQAGGSWAKRARRVAVELSTGESRDDESQGVRLLADIRRVFADADKISSRELLDALIADDEGPWGDVRGKPLTPRGLSRLLEPYEIKSKVVRIDEHTPRGFEREQFADAWRRYLPLPPEAPENATSATTREASQTEPHKQTDVADVAATGDTEERERIRYQADPEYPDWIDQKCHEQHITTREWLGQRKLHARLAGAAA
jgi:hypothetical protein